MVTALINGRVLRAGVLRDGEVVLVDGDRIVGVVPASEVPADAAHHDLEGAMLLPGFIDTQVNGGGGVLFNDSPTVDAIAAIGAAHRRFGTTGFLPTLISDDLAVVRHAVAAVDEAIAQGVPGVLGIHIEGPFLNVDRRGIHRADKIRELDDEGLAVLTLLKRGRTLVTLAPEQTNPATIRRLTDAGVIVAAGHSNATYEQSIAAVEAGATGITHLFNAMSPLTSRAPGLTGAALERPELICGIIVDGHHVSPTTLKIALRCKPPEQLMLVTDAMPSVGNDVDEFMLQGRHIRVAKWDLPGRGRHYRRIASRHGRGARQFREDARHFYRSSGVHGRARAGRVPRPRRQPRHDRARLSCRSGSAGRFVRCHRHMDRRGA